MTASTTTDAEGGNPAFDRPEIKQALATTDPASMSVGGVALKTIVFLVALLAAGAFGWNATVDPATADAAGGYGTVTVTVPGGFWIASILAFGVGIYTAMNPRRAMVSGFVYALLDDALDS